MTGTIKDVADFFRTGIPERDTLKIFRQEWENLSEKDKSDLRSGIGDGTLTY